MSTNINLTFSGSQAATSIAPAIQPATPLADEAAQLVDDLHLAFGKHHARAVHAKGVILKGTFAPTEAARILCKAAVFAIAE